MALRSHSLKLPFRAGLLLCALGARACLSFDDYPEGDVCAAGLDAGIRLRTAPDPALRGCDAGRPTTTDKDEEDDKDASADTAGSAGIGGSQ